MITYRSYTITCDPKPIPIRVFDYDFVHEDYDGAPDSGDSRCGCASSAQACKDRIDDLEDE